MIAYEANLRIYQKTIDDFVVEKKSSPVAPFVVLVTSEIEQDVAAVEHRYNEMILYHSKPVFMES